jgi:autotransporter-associated beta strand protein
MKPLRQNLLLLALLGSSARGGDLFKANNSDALNFTTSWTTAATPGSSDVAVWDSTVTAANSPLLGAATVWGGIRIANPTGLVSIGGTGAAASTLTVGGSGIAMGSATVNLVVNSTQANFNTSQIWNVASGRNLRFGNTGTGSANAKIAGNSSAAVITISGSGVVDANQGGSAGYSDAGGWTGYTGKWVIDSGATLRGVRNGATAWGANTAADAITLNGGTLVVGGISGTQGNWAWNTKMTLADATSSSIDNQLFSGTNRPLKLEGAISGGTLNTGTLTFKNTNSAVMNNDEFGFILSGANTFTGGLTINPSTYVRIGGSAAGTADSNAGNNGSLASTLAITNNGVLRLTRNDAWTFGNPIAGSGQLKVGGNQGTSTSQVVTLSGTNSYTGLTTVVNGRLNLTGSLTSAVTLSAAGRISGAGSTTGLLTTNTGSIIALAGGATTTSLTVNGATFSGATTVSFDTNAIAGTTYDVLTYGLGTVTNPANLTVGWRGTLSDDTVNKKLVFTAAASGTRTWNTTTGTWATGTGTNFVEDDQKFYGGDSVVFGDIASDSTITLSGRLAPAAVTVSNSANKYTFTGTAGTADITGSGSLTKSNGGTLAISTQQSYLGGTTVNGGVLDLTGGGGSGGTIRGTVTVNTGAILKLSNTDSLGFNNDATAVNTVNLVGGTLTSAAGTNQSTTAKFYLTGGTIDGTINLDLFSNNSSITTYASANPSTISVTTMNLRQNDTVFDVANGDAANDLLISSTIGNGSTGNHAMIKNGSGTMKLTGISSFTGNVTVNNGVLDLTEGVLYSSAFNNTNIVTVNTGGTLKLNSFGYSASASLGQLSDYGARRVINGGVIEVKSGTQSVGNDFNVGTNGGTFRYNPAVTTSALTLTGNANSNISLSGPLTVESIGIVTIGEVIDGTGSLTKTGANTLILTATNAYSGNTTVSEGILQIGSGGTTGTLGAGAVTNDASLVFDYGTGAAVTVANTISGNGSLTKRGPGLLRLTATSGYTGATTVEQGTLRISGHLDGTTVTLQSGATLASGAQATAGLGYVKALALSDGSTSTFRIGSSSWDTIVISENDALTLAGTHTITPINQGGLLPGDRREIFDYTGTFGGSFSGFQLSPGTRFQLIDDTENSNIALEYIGGNVIWKGNIDANWDLDTTANWVLESDSSVTNYLQGDTVVFNDSATTSTVTLTGTLSPVSTTFNNPTLAYTLSGAAIAGGSLIKDGAATATLLNNNTYAGTTTVTAGTLAFGNGGTTGGIGSGAVSVASGATLELNRSNVTPGTPDLDYKTTAKLRTVTGAGDIVVTGGGILFSYPGTGLGFSEANSWSGFSGNLIIKGGSEFRTIRNGATSMGTGSVILGDATTSGILAQIEGNWTWTNNITLTGPSNKIVNRSINQAPRSTKLQGIISGSGGLSLEDSAGTMIEPNRGFILTGANTMDGTLTIATGVPVRVGGIPGDTDVSQSGAGISGSLGTATVVNNGTLTFSRTNAHSVSNAISGTGSVRVGIPSGAGFGDTSTQVLTYTGTATYAGATTVNNGTLVVDTGASLGGSAVTVAATATLSGSGSVAAPVTAAGTIAPGTGLGTLTVSGNTAVTGTLAIEVNTTADKLSVTGDLSLSGTLTVTESDAGFTSASYVIAECSGTLTSTLTPPVGYTLTQTGSQLILGKVTGTAFSNWIDDFTLGGQTAINQDPDADGVANGLEFVLKGGNPETPGGTQLPTSSESGTNLIFTFERDDRAKAANLGMTITVEAGTDLSTWPEVFTIGNDTAGSSAGVVISNDGDANPDTVTVTIPKDSATTKFARLKVTGTP